MPPTLMTSTYPILSQLQQHPHPLELFMLPNRLNKSLCDSKTHRTLMGKVMMEAAEKVPAKVEERTFNFLELLEVVKKVCLI